jgi:hypothetical protein
MKPSHKVILISLVVPLVAVAVEAQRGRGSGGWWGAGSYSRMYDPTTVESIAGEIESIDRFTPAEGMAAGIHLTVKAGEESLSVHLGPEWWLERQDTQLEVDDEVEIRGSRVTFQGKPALIAAEVRRADDVLVLRDDDGWPAWSGWRRRAAS